MAQLNMRIVLRNDLLANWEANSDVVLLRGEVGVAYNDDGSARIKLGDGVTPWRDLGWFGGDTTTITNVTETIIQEMIGAPANEETGEEATGIYKDIKDLADILGSPADTENGAGATGIYKDIADIEASIGAPADEEAGVEATGVYKSLADAIAETEANVDTKVNDAIADKFEEITDNGKIDTVMELIQYVEEHGDETSKLVDAFSELQGLVGDTPVDEQIKALLNEQKAADNKLYEKVKYEIVSVPTGTIVNYGEKEIRVMCPQGTVFTKQNVGSTGNANLYYMGFKAYAPEGAVSFKEGDKGVIVDEMFTFDSAFAGKDEYGRNYSICWFALASYDELTDAWTYLGTNSNTSKYLGWSYVVEWYDADGQMISSDGIRINLSNEDCHNNPEPYYMGSLIKEIAVNGVLCDVANNRVDISVDNLVKDGDEITVNEDGSLSIKEINVSKLVTGDTSFVICGGGASV